MDSHAPVRARLKNGKILSFVYPTQFILSQIDHRWRWVYFILCTLFACTDTPKAFENCKFCDNLNCLWYIVGNSHAQGRASPRKKKKNIMKILVPIKRVPDYSTKIKINPDGVSYETDSIKWIVNPFDEIAVEEALRLKEAAEKNNNSVTEVVVVSIGPEETQTQLRFAMAMGADSAILVNTNDFVDSSYAAEIIAKIYSQSDYGLIMLGKQAVDSDSGQTPQILAQILNLPHASFASKVTFNAGNFEVVREIDGGLETVKLPSPSIISTDLRLNEPRYASLPGIQKAKKKPLDIITIDSLGLASSAKVKIKKLSYPDKKQAGKKVATVEELVTLLQSEAKVI